MNENNSITNSSICIPIKVLPGSRIHEVAEDTVLFANTVNFPIEVTFNGVSMLVRPGTKPDAVTAIYIREIGLYKDETPKN